MGTEVRLQSREAKGQSGNMFRHLEQGWIQDLLRLGTKCKHF